MKRSYRRYLSTLAAAGSLFSTSCIPEENEGTNQENQNQNQTTDNQQVEDVASRCVLDHVTPGTFFLDGDTQSLQVGLYCDEIPPARQFGEALAWQGERARERADLVLTVDEMKCLGEDVLYRCTLSLSGLLAPDETFDHALGLEHLTLKDGFDQELEIPVRWALSPAQIEAHSPRFDITKLPSEFIERGMELRIRDTPDGRLIAGTMVSEDGEKIEVFSLGEEGEVIVHRSLDFDQDGYYLSDLVESGEDYNLSITGYERAAGTLTNFALLLRGSNRRNRCNSGLGDEDSDCSFIEAFDDPPVTELVDMVYTAGDNPEGPALKGLALVRTERNTLATIRLGDDEEGRALTLAGEFDALGTLPAFEAINEQIGLTPVADQRLPSNSLIWKLSKEGDLTFFSPEGEERQRISLTPGSISLVQWPYRLEMHRTGDFLLVASASRDFPESHRRFHRLWLDTDGIPTGEMDHLLIPFPCDTIGSLANSTPEATSILCTESTLGIPLQVEWTNMTGVPGEEATLPTSVKGVRPEPSSTPLDSTAGPTIRTLLPDGTVRLATFRSENPCNDLKDCALPLTSHTREGYRLHTIPDSWEGLEGRASLKWGLEYRGAILADGAALEFPLTSPPILIDTPDLTTPGDAAMILAGIDHPDATHGVWMVSKDGSFSAPGLLRFQSPGDDTRFHFTQAEGSSTLLFAVQLRALPGLYEEDETGGLRQAGTFTIAADLLASAIGSAEPLQFSWEDPNFEISAQTTAVVLLPPATAAPVFFPAPENLETMIPLTPEQADEPTNLTTTAGNLLFRTHDDEGPYEQFLLDDLQSLTFSGPFPGSNEDPNLGVLMGRQPNNLRLLKEKKRKQDLQKLSAQKRGIESDDTADTDADDHCLLLERSTLPEALRGEEFLVLGTGDFNGNGLQDLVVQPANTSGAVVLFNDGNSGFLDEILEIPGGPNLIWPWGSNATDGSSRGLSMTPSWRLKIHTLEEL